jgi:pyruvate/2-oxoglutarate dehydrogenase complex dihydrolipoamide dehydrogenase (E3) component
MQAALTASARGHEVILCEKTGSLGGVLRCEEHVPFKKPLAEYIARQAKAIAGTGITVRLNTEMTPELAQTLNPDVIIAALGAHAIIPAVRGVDGKNVHSAEEIYYHPENAGKKVAILGGGLVGAELAIHLSMMGRVVTIIEMLPELNSGDNWLQGLAIRLEIKRLGINVHFNMKALEINAKGVVGESADGQTLFEADTIVYAVGHKPRREEAAALQFCAPEVIRSAIA